MESATLKESLYETWSVAATLKGSLYEDRIRDESCGDGARW